MSLFIEWGGTAIPQKPTEEAMDEAVKDKVFDICDRCGGKRDSKCRCQKCGMKDC